MDHAIDRQEGASAYVAAATLLLARRGQEALNDVIRRMALRAYRPAGESEDALALGSALLTDAFCQAAERDRASWDIPDAVSLLARMLVHRSAFISGPVITTNFDPLVEIAVLREGGYVAIESLDGDGRVSTIDLPVGVRVVHLHGYWRQSDTLHIPVQLTSERAALQASLEDLLQERTVLVIGYGGWDDIFTAALAKAVRHGRHGQLDVLWAFFENSPEEVIRRYPSLIMRTGNLPGRVSFYAGVDFRRLLPALANALGVTDAPGAASRRAVPTKQHDDDVMLLEPGAALEALAGEISETSRIYTVGALSLAVLEVIEQSSPLPADTVIAFDSGVVSQRTRESLGDGRIETLVSRGVVLLQLQRKFAVRHYRIDLADRAAYVTVPHPRHRTQGTLRYRRGTLQYDMITRSVSRLLRESNRQAIDGIAEV